MADDNRLLPSHNEKATQPTPHSKEAAEDMINPFDLRDDYQQAALLCLFVMIVFWVGTMQLIHRYAQEYYTWTVGGFFIFVYTAFAKGMLKQEVWSRITKMCTAFLVLSGLAAALDAIRKMMPDTLANVVPPVARKEQ